MAYLRCCKPLKEVDLINIFLKKNKVMNLRFTSKVLFTYQIYVSCVCLLSLAFAYISWY